MDKKPQKSCIGFRGADGVISDVEFHAEIMNGVDDTPLRRRSAIKAMTQFRLTQAEAESLFDVAITGTNQNTDVK